MAAVSTWIRRHGRFVFVSGGLGYFCTHVSYVVLLVCTKNVEDGWDDSVVDWELLL